MRKSKTILVVDDEPYYLDWLFDFIKSLGYDYVSATTVRRGLVLLGANQYRAVIADLNIPAGEDLLAGLESRGSNFARFPGLMLADFARNHHHTGRQVIVYSVHDDAEVRKEAERLGCTYMLKGRPRSFKEELKEVLSYDPLGHLP
jgi:CheY-like chemotaxis protein